MADQKPTLEYSMASPRNIIEWMTSGFFIGLIATPPALCLAVLSAGMGHGHYAFARALFPVPMLATRLTDNYISLPVILVAVLQFPLCGVIVGYDLSRRRMIAVVAIVVVHVAATVGCLTGLLPNFS